jgi:hypothetical protein
MRAEVWLSRVRDRVTATGDAQEANFLIIGKSTSGTPELSLYTPKDPIEVMRWPAIRRTAKNSRRHGNDTPPDATDFEDTSKSDSPVKQNSRSGRALWRPAENVPCSEVLRCYPLRKRKGGREDVGCPTPL